MNRTSRRSAAKAAEALLEAGRTQPALSYDVELGLTRHHHWLRNDAPLPEWASTGLGASTSMLRSVVVKTIVSGVLIGTVGVATWYAQTRPQPSAASVEAAAAVQHPPAQPTDDPAPATSEAWLAHTPIPVPESSQPVDHAPHRTAHALGMEKRTPRSIRAHRERLAARVPSSAERSPADTSTPEPASVATSERAEATATPERKAIRAAQTEQPQRAPQAQGPDDLAEMQQVASAEQLLVGSPERALTLVHQGDQRFAHGYFQQERAYITIMALIRLGRIEEARVRAASFAKRFPPLPYGARIRSALEAHKPATARDGD